MFGYSTLSINVGLLNNFVQSKLKFYQTIYSKILYGWLQLLSVRGTAPSEALA